MTSLHALPAALALALTAAFLCGLRPFWVVLLLACAQSGGWVALPAGLDLLEGPLVLAVCVVLALAERVSDTRSLHGHPEDLLLSSLRVPMGAVLPAAWMVDLFGPAGWLALPMGAALAACGQALRAALRAMGGLLGWQRTLVGVLLLIDVLVPALMWLAWLRPWAATVVLACTLLLAVPAAVWWARELRSRWRRWAALNAGPLA